MDSAQFRSEAGSGVTKHLTTPDNAGDKRVAVLCALKIRI